MLVDWVQMCQYECYSRDLIDAQPETHIYVIMEAVSTANHLTDTDKQNIIRRYTN